MTDVTLKFFSNGRIPRSRRGGFTLVEVLVALTIIVMAGSALLLATHAAMDTATESLDQTIAQGIARQLLDEAMGLAYVEPGSDPLVWQLGRESGESPAARITHFDDTDDFAEYWAFPPVDPWNKRLGLGDDQGNLRHPNFQLDPNHFKNWLFVMSVFYVDEDNPATSLPPGSVSGMRAINIQVYKRQSQHNYLLASIRRVYSYVPSPQ